MSNIFGAPRAGAPNGPDAARTVPKGDTVGSYNSYLDAQKAVDYLADQQFPVQMVSIVGNELKMVERVTGRLTYPRVALSGALSGMWFGLFVGIMLSFFSTTDGAFSILTSVLMGAAFFMLFGIVTYAMQRGKRDFTSTSQVVATNYDVVVSFEAANEARRLLHQLPMTQQDASVSAGYPQRDNQHQPNQHQPYQQGQHPPYQPGQQGSEPQRPAGWTDPYGQRTPEAGQHEAGRHAAVSALKHHSPLHSSPRPLSSRWALQTLHRPRRSPPNRPASPTRTCRTAAPNTGSASPMPPSRNPVKAASSTS
ncbi:general stress protein [Pseudarthrobacter sp. So.54]